MLRVGNKHIEINEALQVYKDRKACKTYFGINNKEYNELLTKMLSHLQDMAKAESSQDKIGSGSAGLAGQTGPAGRCQVQSYENGTSQYASLDSFSTGILPSTYAPIQSTQAQVDNLVGRGAGPTHAANMHEMTTTRSGLAHGDNVDTNRNLMDRRFFSGSNPTPMSRSGSDQAVMPLRFQDTTNMQYRDMQRQGTGVSQDHADHRIFSRTFDLAPGPGQLPDITNDRQSIETRRRSGWPSNMH